MVVLKYSAIGFGASLVSFGIVRERGKELDWQKNKDTGRVQDGAAGAVFT